VISIRLVATALLAVVLVGCMTDVGGLPTYWNFENRTETAVTVVWHRESGEQIELATVDAGKSLSLSINPYGNSREICDDGEFIFRSPTGEEVMRGPMTCNPWVIEASGSPDQD
jgi:hypothetical protein